MPVVSTNLIQGPGYLYVGAFGAAEPADSAINATPASSTWTDVGGTMDGVTITTNPEWAELTVDQVVDVVGRRLTKRDIQVATNMAEPTLENFAIVNNGGTVTASAAYKTYDPTNDDASTQPTYRALLFDGYAPQTTAGVTMRRRLAVRKALSIESVETAYKKDEMTLYPVTFAAHYVSSVIRPFRYTDQQT